MTKINQAKIDYYQVTKLKRNHFNRIKNLRIKILTGNQIFSLNLLIYKIKITLFNHFHPINVIKG